MFLLYHTAESPFTKYQQDFLTRIQRSFEPSLFIPELCVAVFPTEKRFTAQESVRFTFLSPLCAINR